MPAPTINSIVDRALRAIKRDAIPAHLRRRGDQSEIDMESMGKIIREAVTQGSQIGVVTKVKTAVTLVAPKPRNEAIDKRVLALQDDKEAMLVALTQLKEKCGLKEMRELVERNSGVSTIRPIPADKMRKVTRAARIKLAAVRRREKDEEI